MTQLCETETIKLGHYIVVPLMSETNTWAVHSCRAAVHGLVTPAAVDYYYVFSITLVKIYGSLSINVINNLIVLSSFTICRIDLQ